MILILILILACILRCLNINQSFWWDEIWSTLPYARAASIKEVTSNIGYYFNNHIFYSLLARCFLKLLGESEVVLRLPALFMGLLGILVLFQFGRRYLNTSAGIIASFFLAISPFHVDHSSEARGYSALALFSLLSSFYFIKGLKTNERWSWILFILFTVLGFYSHVFMIAVSLSQFLCVLGMEIGQRFKVKNPSQDKVIYKHFFISLFISAFIVFLLYSPVFMIFFKNLQKVRLVSVDRFPFILALLNSIFPGFNRGLSMITYAILFLAGSLALFRKDLFLFGYLLILTFIPVILYLLINPMFVFERYFIFLLPFVLLILGEGIVVIAGIMKGYQKGLMTLMILFISWFQLPSLYPIVTQDRQNYREAVRFVEKELREGDENLVFTIGYAGGHFQYYSKNITILKPENLNELLSKIQNKRHLWCLITAWLPEIRPPYEDRFLYSEKLGQVEIYNYVKKNFRQVKHFSSKFPVDIYYLER